MLDALLAVAVGSQGKKASVCSMRIVNALHQHRRPCGSSSSRRGPRSVRNFRWGRRRPGGRRAFGAVISMPKDTSTRARTGPRSRDYYSSRGSANHSGPQRRDTVSRRRNNSRPGTAPGACRYQMERRADLHGVRAAPEGRAARPPPRGSTDPGRTALRFRGGRLVLETWGTFTRTVRGVSLQHRRTFLEHKASARRHGTSSPARRPSVIVL